MKKTNSKKIKGKNNPAYKHGYAILKGKEYRAWISMRQRCNNPNNADYKDYGGRGIKVCGRWINSFKNFIEDMRRAPSSRHSIDRMNNDSNYEPGNCQWSTGKVQCNHTRKNIFLTHGGETKTMAQWSEQLNIGYSTLYNRHKRGKWSDSLILTTPVS